MIQSVFRILIILVIAGSAELVSAGGMEVLESLSRALRSEEAWFASYHQEYVPAGMTSGEVVDGTVWISWPNRALFSSGEPPLRMMGLQGRSVRLLDLDVPSCDDHELTAEEWASIPLAAVLDPAGAVDGFSVLEHGESGFVLIPREPSGVARVTIELGPDNLPQKITITDPQDGTNEMSFVDWQGKRAPPDGMWLPKPPEGLNCIGDLQ